MFQLVNEAKYAGKSMCREVDCDARQSLMGYALFTLNVFVRGLQSNGFDCVLAKKILIFNNVNSLFSEISKELKCFRFEFPFRQKPTSFVFMRQS